MHVPFSKFWFDADARVYNHDLAKASLGLVTSAFRPNPQLTEEGFAADYNVRSFLDQAGFADLRSDDYDKIPACTLFPLSWVIRRSAKETVPSN